MLELRLPKLCDRRDDLSGHPPALEPLVSGGLVGNEPEEWYQRHGTATGARAEELQNGLGVAT